jgi:hypothetical protein
MSVLIRNCPVSQITDTEVTCSQFSSGTAQTLTSVEYDVEFDLVQRVILVKRVNPRAFLYWAMITAPAGNNTFEITQTITTGNFDAFFAESGHGSHVFDSDCVSLERRITQTDNIVRVRFNAPTAGIYFIAIKFNAHNLIGEPQPSPERTVHYDFTTTGVPVSTSRLDLFRH